MFEKPITRAMLLLSLAALTSACATAADPWRLQELDATERARRASGICPVVLTNNTADQLDAAYEVGGISSVLGTLPAGHSLSFGVECDVRFVHAYAVSDGVFSGDFREYRTVGDVQPDRTTRLRLSVSDRIR